MSRSPDDWTALLSHLSHEMRTPLSVAQGYARMLASGRYGPLTDAQTQAVQATTRVCEQLHGLADHLSLLAKLERGEVTFARGPVALDPLLAEIAAAHTAPPDHPVAVTHAPAATPFTVLADPVHLRRALTALLATVVRTAPDDSTVTLAARPGATLLIARPDRLDALAAADDSTLTPLPDFEAGLGLSLAIARRVLAAAGGDAALWRGDAGLLGVRVRLPLASS